MPYIKEPYGIDFTVENMPVTKADRKIISDIITHYKSTGKIKKINIQPVKLNKPGGQSAKRTTKSKQV